MNVGYNSADAGQVHRQVEDMMSRGIQGAIAAWYGPTSTVIDNATMLLKNEAEAKAGQFEFAIMEDVGALGSAAVNNRCDVTDQLISDLSYVATQYESSSALHAYEWQACRFLFRSGWLLYRLESRRFIDPRQSNADLSRNQRLKSGILRWRLFLD